jgi:hypothetical protein
VKAPTAIYVCNCYVNGIFQKEIRGTHGLIIHGIVLDGPRRNPPHSPKLAFQRIPCRLKIRGTIFEWLLFSCCKFCLDVDIICGIFCASEFGSSFAILIDGDFVEPYAILRCPDI